MDWKTFKKVPFRRGGNKTLGTLSADARRPILLIGALLREQGFDVTKRYELLFDEDSVAIGLRESTAVNAFKVGCQRNAAHSSKAYSIQAIGFCKYFGLNKRYTVRRVKQQNDGVWVLYLAEIDLS
jgi:hypothetical protein